MMENTEMLIVKLLRNKIEENENIIRDSLSFNNSSIIKYKDALNKFRTDINEIINIDEKILIDVISELEFYDDEEMLSMQEYLLVIKRLLTSNKKRGTTYDMDASQKIFIDRFFDKIDEYDLSIDEKKEETKKKYAFLEEKVNKYEKLLLTIIENKNNEFINDNDLIAGLLSECGLGEDEKREVLLEIIKYNREIYNRLLELPKVEIEIEELSEEAVISLFEEFGYDFNKLREKYRKDILEFGSLSRMREVFEVLKENKFPKFNETKKGIDLTTLLIKSNGETILSVLETANKCGLTSTDLLDVVPALVIQTHTDAQTKTNKIIRKGKTSGTKIGGEITKNSTMFSGHSDDFIKNCEFLENEGLDLKFILRKARIILITDHNRLVNNFKLFKQYGFSFNTNVGEDEVHPAYTCLITNNFAEIADAFIESMPLGYKYIKNNLSKIYLVTSPDDLLFYNIYKSNMDVDVIGREIIPEGPFYGDPSHLKLSGKITRYKGSGFEDIPYKGITEETKYNKTGIVEVSFENKEIFDDALDDCFNNYASEEDVENLDEIGYLDENYRDDNNPYVYNIDGVRISRLKTLRLYSYLKEKGLDVLDNSLIYALTHNSLVSEGEFERIVELNNGRRI